MPCYGVWTYGFGVTRSSSGGPVGPDTEPIGAADAEDMLKDGLEVTEGWVSRLIKKPLSENQFSALTSFTFNVGCGALQRSTLRMKLNRGEFQNAADEFPKLKFANKRILAGLVRRRAAEQKFFPL